MRILRGAAVTLAAAAVAAGCSSSGGSDDAPRATTPASAAVGDSAACSYLTSAERRKLAGVALDTVVASDSREGGSSQCRWSSDKGLIEVTSVPATAWAKTLPQVVAQLSTEVKTAQDRKDLARAQRLLTGAASFTGAEACDAFTTLATIDGARKGSAVAVKFIPISTSEVGVSGQICTGGVLTSIVYSEPGLIESKKYETRVATAVRAAQRRAAG